MAAPRKEEPYVSFIEAAGHRVHVEVEQPEDGFRPVSRQRGLGDLSDTFRPVMAVAETFVEQARSSRARPDEVSLRFGIKLAATGEAVLSQGIGDGHFEVTLSWSRQDQVPAVVRSADEDDVW